MRIKILMIITKSVSIVPTIYNKEIVDRNACIIIFIINMNSLYIEYSIYHKNKLKRKLNEKYESKRYSYLQLYSISIVILAKLS